MLKKELSNKTEETPQVTREIKHSDFYEFSLPNGSEKLTLEIREIAETSGYLAEIFIHDNKNSIQELHMVPKPDFAKGEIYDEHHPIPIDRNRDGGTTTFNLDKNCAYKKILIPAEDNGKPYILTSKKEFCDLTFIKRVNHQVNKEKEKEKKEPNEKSIQLPSKSLAELEEEKNAKIKKQFNFAELKDLFGVPIVKTEFKDSDSCWSFIFDKKNYAKLKTELPKNGVEISQIILTPPLSFSDKIKLTIPVRFLKTFEEAIKNAKSNSLEMKP